MEEDKLVLEPNKIVQKCPKCNHLHVKVAPPTTECPKCGVIYDKVNKQLLDDMKERMLDEVMDRIFDHDYKTQRKVLDSDRRKRHNPDPGRFAIFVQKFDADWEGETNLKEDELDMFEDAPEEEAEYERKLKPLILIVLLGVALYFIGVIFGLYSFSEVIVSVFMIVAILLFMVVEPFISVECKKCGNFMTRHEYTNDRANYRAGNVHICHHCKTKYITSKPTLRE